MEEKIVKKLESFFKNYPLVKYKKGEIILKPGERRTGVTFMKKGYARVYTLSKEGKETTLPMFKPLFYCSLLNCLVDRGNNFYFEALTGVEVWKAPRDEFMEFVKKNDDLYQTLTKVLIKELASLACGIQNLISGDAKSKVAALIYSMASNFGTEKDGKVKIKFAVPHRIMAGMVGLTRETVTLQILKMEKEGLLNKEGRFLVVEEMKRLEESF